MFYEQGRKFIFISYSHRDNDIVLPVIREMKARGFRVWYDEGIQVGTEWSDTIATHIEHCDVFITFMSDNAAASENCRDEISYAKELGKAAWMVMLKDDVRMRGGLAMQSNRFQKLFYSRHATLTSFVDALCTPTSVQACRDQAMQDTQAKPTGNPAKPESEFDRLLRLANAGDAGSQCELGKRYYNGNSVRQDYAEAVKWYRKSAEQGYASAQNNLGYMYQNGFGVAQDYAEAVKWYRKSAEQGNDSAQNNLGYTYHNGFGVSQDYAEAVKWYRKSAEQGNDGAQNNLGYMYQNGFGVAQDYAEAVRWYQKAADNGNKDAAKALQVMKDTGAI